MNGGTYSTGCQPACSNNAKDSFEADKDCGGACGATCTIGAICSAPTDCATNNCEEGFCAVKRCSIPDDCGSGETSTCQYDPESTDSGICISCEDNIANFNESDKDCGGWCGANCEPGAHCNSNDDCITGECSSDEVCVGEPPALATPQDLVVNEVMNSGSTSSVVFPLNNTSETCEFVEIANISNNKLNLSPLNLLFFRDESNYIKFALKGTLESKNLLVLHNCEHAFQIPTGTRQVVLSESDVIAKKGTNEKVNGFITGSGATYTISIVDSSNEESKSDTTVSFNVNNKSYNRETDFDNNTELKAIADLQSSNPDYFKYTATPGYCGNGGLFINNCVTSCENGKKDDDEMGIDCGGACSKGCENNTPCQKAEDCLSGYCSPENVCAIKRCEDDKECGIGGKCNDSGVCERCDDGILNGYETDTDCGGKCAVKCDIGDGCNGDSDCESATCDPGTNKCIVSDCEDPVEGEIVINEVLNKIPSSAKPMSLTTSNQVEFIELYNNTTKKLSLKNMLVNIKHYKTNGTDYETSSDKAFSIPLNGCLEANKYLLIYSNANTVEGLPATAVSFPTSSLAAANALVNTRKIDMTLTQDTTTLHKITMEAATESVSAALSTSPAKNDNGYDILVNHDTINTTYKHTPGASNYYTAE